MAKASPINKRALSLFKCKPLKEKTASKSSEKRNMETLVIKTFAMGQLTKENGEISKSVGGG